MSMADDHHVLPRTNILNTVATHFFFYFFRARKQRNKNEKRKKSECNKNEWEQYMPNYYMKIVFEKFTHFRNFTFDYH